MRDHNTFRIGDRARRMRQQRRLLRIDRDAGQRRRSLIFLLNHLDRIQLNGRDRHALSLEAGNSRSRLFAIEQQAGIAILGRASHLNRRQLWIHRNRGGTGGHRSEIRDNIGRRAWNQQRHGLRLVRSDTLSERADVRFTGLPNFAPEILRRVVLKDPTKTKQLRKALDDMAEEGVTQVFYPEIGSNWVIGVVGQLQLDVLVSRLEAEYKVAAGLEMAPYETARWISSDDPAALKEFIDLNRGALAKDRDGNPVFMAKTAWEVGYVSDRYPKVKFAATRER